MKVRLHLIFCAFLLGCAQAPSEQLPSTNGATDTPISLAPSQQDIVWPAPPEKARIRFVTAFEGPGDLGIRPSTVRRLFDAVAGAKDTSMVRPYGVSVTGDKILVCDPGLHAIHLFDRSRSAYQLIAKVSDESLSSPVGVAVGQDRFFVADSTLGKIFIFDIKGQHLGTIKGLERPTGLAWDSASGRLYAADTLAHQIVVFDREGWELFTFGKRGIAEGEFNFPSHISLAGGRLLVNDNMNFRIQAFDTEGRFLSSFGHHGDGSGHFSQPKGVSTDSKGNVYVAGATIDRVQVFSPEGEFLLAFGSKGFGPGQFVMPTGVTIHDDRIYVADSYNSRIQVFEYVGDD
jgi:sugar lactone lactonase YvrE